MTQLIHGDCLEKMATLPDGSVDLILADPPYGTTQCKWDVVIPLEPMWEQLKRIIKPNGAIVMTAAQPFTTILIASNMKMFKYHWVWDKKAVTGFLNAKKQPLRRVEDVCVFYSKQVSYNPIMTVRGKPKKKVTSGQSSVYGNFSRKEAFNNVYYPTQIIEATSSNMHIHDGRWHPTQKPVALMEYLIKTYTSEGETVLDFCMGSGTTGVAAVQTGRHFIGIERDGDYFGIARERISQASVTAEAG
ncbi:DNA-methyltransferase [Endozoicomonas lisbonensis]|uniref:Methyltransferase n=1 Tax=Endozoicomonas lisbonensis TaxID=3120522 RepID=A0ABV2SQM5_9GAMM